MTEDPKILSELRSGILEPLLEFIASLLKENMVQIDLEGSITSDHLTGGKP